MQREVSIVQGIIYYTDVNELHADKTSHYCTQCDEEKISIYNTWY